MAVRKILLVDDSPAHLKDLENAVAGVDAHIFTATSGKEAVARAKSEKPDIIFMDIVMSDLDGFGACREIKQDADTGNIPVVFVSTKNNRADKLWAEKQGAEDLITKPFQPEQLLAHIERHA
jgi:twitching motility two-component system response regulator PilH